MDDRERRAIMRLRQGEIGGLEFLVREYHRPALRVAFLITHDQALAEDVVQSAFLRLTDRIERFDTSRPFKPWFLRLVTNEALQVVTRHPHHPLGDAVAALLGQNDDRADDPLKVIEAAETKAAIWAALERLTPEQHAAIVARYYLDLHGGALASHLDAPPGTVRRRIVEARARLRHLIPPWLYQGVAKEPGN